MANFSCSDNRGARLNYARHQQYRRLARAAAAATASGASVLLALAVAGAGAVSAAGAILVLAVGLGLYARHWLSLAERSRVAARSEDEVQRALARLETEAAAAPLAAVARTWGHRLGRDRPTGLAFAVETKCAARRPVVSPAQPGGTRREVLGSNGLPGSER